MKYLIITCLLLLFSCKVQQDIALFETSYLLFPTEAEADWATELFFKAGVALEYEQGVYDDSTVYLIEVMDVSVLDMEYREGDKWVRAFPEDYITKVVDFIITVE